MSIDGAVDDASNCFLEFLNRAQVRLLDMSLKCS